MSKKIEQVATGNGPIMWVVFDKWENGRRVNPKRFWTEAEAKAAA